MSISAPRYRAAPTRLVGPAGRAFAIFRRELSARAGWGTYLGVGLAYAVFLLFIVLPLGIAPPSLRTLGLFSLPYAVPVAPFLVLLVAAATGAGSLADDLESRSVILYLSRPVRLLDYLGAKIAAVVFWIAIVAVVPPLVGVLLVALLGLVPLALALEAAAAFLAIGMLMTTFFAALVVALSAATAKALYAGASFFALVLASDVAASALAGATGNPWVPYVSPVTDLASVTAALFRTGAGTATDPATSAAYLLAAAILLFVGAGLRIQRVQEVGE